MRRKYETEINKSLSSQILNQGKVCMVIFRFHSSDLLFIKRLGKFICIPWSLGGGGEI